MPYIDMSPQGPASLLGPTSAHIYSPFLLLGSFVLVLERLINNFSKRNIMADCRIEPESYGYQPSTLTKKLPLWADD